MSVSFTDPASSSPKKRKHGKLQPDGTKLPRKKSKTEKKARNKHKDEDSHFRVTDASITLSIPPRFAENPLDGAKELLESLLMRYVAALGGVLLCYSNVTFLSPTASIKNECPFLICDVGLEATIWSPQIGMKMSGTVNVCSPDHISLLIHQTFNVSIPRHHVPESWEFEHGAAENDPEFQLDGFEYDAVTGPNTTAERGQWVSGATGDKFGGLEGKVEFTVVGLTVANQMLSLIGSLQPDPFSSEHVPKSAIVSQENQEVEETEAPVPFAELSDEVYSEDDPFEALSKTRQDLAERRAVIDTADDSLADKAKEEKEKRKRKEEKRARKEQKAADKAVTKSDLIILNPVVEKTKKKRKRDAQEG